MLNSNFKKSKIFLVSRFFFTEHLFTSHGGHQCFAEHTGWRMKCRTIDCAHNTFLLLQKHLTPGTELILIGWKIVPNEEHVQCDLLWRPGNVVQLRAHIVKLYRVLSEDLCRKVVCKRL